MEQNPEQMLQQLTHENRALKAQVVAATQILLRVPHGQGDHTDHCRFYNGGLPPTGQQRCHCHVSLVQKALREGLA
ncbi:MAG: hypothetical protein HQL60_07095 [Magnetococcales bacterium]|nr:hypothetical protein [Magnetococcales bacterium]